MHGAKVEMHKSEKFSEDLRVCMNHDCRVKYIWNTYIYIWLDKYEKNSRVRYFIKKCVEHGHMAKLY